MFHEDCPSIASPMRRVPDTAAESARIARSSRLPDAFQREEPLPGAIRIHTSCLCLGLTEFAEAGDLTGIDRRNIVCCSQAVAECTLAFGSPHDAVDIVRSRIVLDQ